MATRVHDAGTKAAKFVINNYVNLVSLVAEHMINGRGAAELRAEYEAGFEEEFGAAPAPVEEPAPKAAAKPAGAGKDARIQACALAVVDALFEAPDPATLAALLTRLSAHAFAQCLPNLPPSAGARTVGWLHVLEDRPGTILAGLLATAAAALVHRGWS